MKRRIIEEKLEKLGVGGSLSGSVPSIHAPHARAASVRHFLHFPYPSTRCLVFCETYLRHHASLDIVTRRSCALVLQTEQITTIPKQLCVEFPLDFSSTSHSVDTFTRKL